MTMTCIGCRLLRFISELLNLFVQELHNTDHVIEVDFLCSLWIWKSLFCDLYLIVMSYCWFLDILCSLGGAASRFYSRIIANGVCIVSAHMCRWFDPLEFLMQLRPMTVDIFLQQITWLCHVLRLVWEEWAPYRWQYQGTLVALFHISAAIRIIHLRCGISYITFTLSALAFCVYSRRTF